MEKIDEFFSKIKTIYNELLNKKEESRLSYTDKYMFQLLSFSISLIHDSILIGEVSYVTQIMYKRVIETIMILSKLNKENSVYLDSYNSYNEKLIYDKYKDKLDFSLFHFDNDKFELVNIEDVKAKLPFIFPDYDLNNIVSSNNKLNEYYNMVNDLDNKNVNIINIGLIIFGLKLIDSLYKDIKIKYKNTLDYEKSFIYNHPNNKMYMSYVDREAEILLSIEGFKDISYFIKSIGIDKAFGFSEVLEVKFKAIVDYISGLLNTDSSSLISLVDNNTYNSLLYDEAELLSYRSGYMIKSNIDLENEYINTVYVIDLLVLYLLRQKNVSEDTIDKFIEIINSKKDYDLKTKLEAN